MMETKEATKINQQLFGIIKTYIVTISESSSTKVIKSILLRCDFKMTVFLTHLRLHQDKAT